VSVNKSGCIAADTIIVAYTLKPRFSLGTDQLICPGQTITLQPSLTQNWQLRWQDGSSKSSLSITQPGMYSLTAFNTCGTSSDDILFTKGLCKVYLPNAFSPNGDTKNDVFKVYGTDALTDFHLQIFNRYGQLIFETSDKNKGWDGTVNNKPAVNGNYVYLLQFKEILSAQLQVQRGSCLLIR
jgi:gliding motility-associated-like protein